MSEKEVSPVSAWARGEVVTLPSGHNMRLRQLDVLDVLAPDGSVPNFLLPLLSGQKKQVETTAEDMIKLAPLLNRIAKQCVVEPRIVETIEQVDGGEGITLALIPFNDKMAMLNYAMGGQAAVEQTTRFLQKQARDLATTQPEKRRGTESEAGDS